MNHVAAVPMRAARPWESFTALGAPVEPEVKMRTRMSAGSTRGVSDRRAAASRSRHAGSSISMTSVPPRSRPESSGIRLASVRTTTQSVWRTSRASSSPRRVSLMPTITAPTRAAPKSANRYSGVLPRSTPTWNGPASGRRAASASDHRRLSTATSRQLHWRSSTTIPGPSSSARRSRSATSVTAGAVMGSTMGRASNCGQVPRESSTECWLHRPMRAKCVAWSSNP